MDRRGFILVMDSFGLGGAPDADAFGDTGADTFGHIFAATPDLRLPALERLGLHAAHGDSIGRPLAADGAEGIFGFATEASRGKDTPSGHWEMAGAPVAFDWGYFPDQTPSFPPELVAALIREAGLPGILGNRHASGTEIIERLGPEHIATGKPICYTSADSVFQIAAHEDHFGLERLYAVCRIARRLVDPYNIGRIIARPFVGTPGSFRRTGNRKDLAVMPPEPTLLDRLTEAGRAVRSIGKIGDIFAHSGTGEEIKADGNAALMQATLEAAAATPAGSLTLTNFVDFDTLYGHRRDVAGYAAALETFDAWLPRFRAMMRPGDVAIITADHGCDPTWRGSDHTRENVPVLVFGPGIAGRRLGRRDGFADIGQTLAAHLGIAPLAHGKAFDLGRG